MVEHPGAMLHPLHTFFNISVKEAEVAPRLSDLHYILAQLERFTGLFYTKKLYICCRSE